VVSEYEHVVSEYEHVVSECEHVVSEYEHVVIHRVVRSLVTKVVTESFLS